MKQPPAADGTFGFQDDPPPDRGPGKRSDGKVLSEAEAKKAHAAKLLAAAREKAERQEELDAIPHRDRTGAAWVTNGPLIGAILTALLGVIGLAVCAFLNLALPFYIVPGIFLMFALIGVVYVWFGLND